jgi:hypothetical protein
MFLYDLRFCIWNTMWLFLQQYVYEVKCSWDTPSPKAAELATALQLRNNMLAYTEKLHAV